MHRRSILLAAVFVVSATPFHAIAADTPDATLSEFAAALQGGQFNKAAGSFYPELSTQSEAVSSIAHKLNVLQQEVGNLAAMRQLGSQPNGTTFVAEIARRVPLSDTRQVIRTVQRVYEGPSKLGINVRYAVAAEQSPSGWRIRNLTIHFPADYPNLPGLLQRLGIEDVTAPRPT
ncbi:MAG: hypothetical protein PHS32_04895 [Rhodoferax sp.]|uniref:hypothetical protein n=1 Tax=Rhodoferax sp. TaxID=50421 RepID=UPI00262B1D6F|nr:hypothetical protein [Rhodoferax sp.]MDD5333065.1 hypothetical protein [Rhodoferax sp.]